MAQADQPKLVFSDLMAAVGSVLLHWGYLELEMLKKLKFSPASSTPRATTLQRWRAAAPRTLAGVSSWTDEMEREAQVRNLLAHGLVGASAQPESGDPHVVCRDIEGVLHEIKHGDLIAAAQNLHVLRVRMLREPDDLFLVRPEA